MQLMRCALIAAFTVSATAFADDVEITHGDLRVVVNDRGVIVGGADGGMHTVDGRAVALPALVTEWQSVTCRAGDRLVRVVATGSEADWADRPQFVPHTIEATSDRIVVTARHGALELRNAYSFSESGRYLLVQVTLTNLGAETLTDIWYARTWRPTDPTRGWTFPDDAMGLVDLPGGVCRHQWMFDNIGPGDARGATLSFATTAAGARADGVDVPLHEWLPGFLFGDTFGIATGDFDQDGWVDVFALQSAMLWRNVDGQEWVLAADLNPILPPTEFRYSISWGDWDNNGLPDFATEARNCCGGNQCNHLIYNLGDATFANVTRGVVDKDLCDADTETNCWGDVDGDGDLDLWMPTYPPTIGDNHGNFFLENLGPTGPGGAYVFTERAPDVGLFNVPGAARPEGAQFIDIDFDGDLDAYSGGVLFQNQSSLGAPLFASMTEIGSGIGFSTQLDEGCAYFDYDFDGDFDLAIVYSSPGVKIFENQGDGTFFEAAGIIDEPLIGLNLGLSIEDWDNDGDMDFTTRQVFRRNMYMETGGDRHFTIATHGIPAGHIDSATPAWFDWDRDGDLDCALGNWYERGRFYENTLYDASTPSEERRNFRVRVLRATDEVPEGLEFEYGAMVEVVVHGEPRDFRRRKFVASGHGYLNQNEYTLHFALPADPVPGDPDDDLEVDVIVDLPLLPSDGYCRIDRNVNPVLGALDIGTVKSREIRVFRSGHVEIDGTMYPPTGDDPVLTFAGGGLRMPHPQSGLVAPGASGGDLIGIDFDTIDGTVPQRIRQVVVDGELGAPVDCGGIEGNVLLWDVTEAPTLLDAVTYAPAERNDRTWIPVDFPLEVGRHYRLVATSERLRLSGAAADHGDLRVNGGLRLAADACDGDAIAAAVTQKATAVSFRFSAMSTARVPGDVTGDGVVDVQDLLAVLTAWGPCPGCAEDIDGDGSVGVSDLLVVLAEWDG